MMPAAKYSPPKPKRTARPPDAFGRLLGGNHVYLDDVRDGDPCQRLRVRGSLLQVHPFNMQLHPVTAESGGSGVAIFDAEGNWMPDYEAQLTRDFYGEPISAETARRLAKRIRADFPAPGAS